MPRFAANLSMMFNEVPFLDRFALAAKAGFKGVEFLFPYEHPAAEIAARLKDNGLQQVLFNAPAGDFAKGGRGMAAIPGKQAAFGTASSSPWNTRPPLPARGCTSWPASSPKGSRMTR